MVDATLVNLAELGVLVAGVVIALQQLNDIKKTRESELETRQIQLFTQVHDKLSSEPLKSTYFEMFRWEWKDYDDFVEKYGVPWNPREDEKHLKRSKKFLDVFGYFEGLGVIAQTSDMDIELLVRFGGPLTSLWRKFEPIVYELRRRYSVPRAWEEMEELYLRMIEFRRSTTIFDDEQVSRRKRREALGLPKY